MDENDFKDLLNEIDSMDIEEYNKYHEKALEMKKMGWKKESEDTVFIFIDNHQSDYDSQDAYIDSLIEESSGSRE